MIEKLYLRQGQGKMSFIYFRNKAGTFSVLVVKGKMGASSVIQERKGRTWRACWWEEVSVEEQRETLLYCLGWEGQWTVGEPGGGGAEALQELVGRLQQGKKSETLGRNLNIKPWLHCKPWLHVGQWGTPASGLYNSLLGMTWIFLHVPKSWNNVFQSNIQHNYGFIPSESLTFLLAVFEMSCFKSTETFRKERKWWESLQTTFFLFFVLIQKLPIEMLYTCSTLLTHRHRKPFIYYNFLLFLSLVLLVMIIYSLK